MYIPEKRKTKKNKLEKCAELGILVKYKDIYIYKIYVPTRREEKIVRTSNIKFNEKKKLITNKKKKEELTSTNQNPLNKEQHNAEKRILTTLNNPKTPKLGVNK